MGERLEICNPEHIKKVREYELKHGYDRYSGESFEPLNQYMVTISAPVNAAATAIVYVEAHNEEEAEALAHQMVDEGCLDEYDFDYSWNDGEINLDECNVDSVEKNGKDRPNRKGGINETNNTN
jgi:hypothetical protein